AFSVDVSAALDDGYFVARLREASAKLQANDAAAAGDICREVLSHRPDDPEALQLMLQVYAATGDSENEARLRQRLAKSESEAIQPEETAEQPAAQADLKPDMPEAQMLLGDSMAEAGNADAALDAYMSAADLFEANGQPLQALEAYLRSDALDLEVMDIIPHIERCYDACGASREAAMAIAAKAEDALKRQRPDHARDLYAVVGRRTSAPDDLRIRYAQVVLLADPACTHPEDALSVARDFAARGDHEKAAIILESISEASPDNEDVLIRLADAYEAQGRMDAMSDAGVRLARVWLRQARYADARSQLSRVLARDPMHIGALESLADAATGEGDAYALHNAEMRLASALVTAGQFERAIEMLDRYAQQTPSDPEVRELRARALEQWALQGNPDASRRAAAEYEELGDMLNQATRGRRAVDYYQRSSTLYPPTPDLLLKLARAHFRAGDTIKSADVAMRAIDELEAIGRNDDVVREAEQFSALMPNETALGRFAAERLASAGFIDAAVEKLLKLSEVFVAKGERAEAVACVERAAAINPTAAEPLEQLARLHRRAGNEEAWAAVQLRLADVHEKAGRLERAVRALTEHLGHHRQATHVMERLVRLTTALGAEREAQGWRRRLADTWHGLGNREKEWETLNEALAHARDDEALLQRVADTGFALGYTDDAVAAVTSLAAICRNAGRLPEARRALEGALAKAPGVPDLLRAMMQVSHAASDTDEALQWGRQWVSRVLETQGADAAVAAFDEVLACNPRSVPLKREGVDLLRRIGRTEEALTRLVDIARQQRADGDLTGAEATLREVVEADPARMEAHQELVEVYIGLGETASAAEQLCWIAAEHEARDEFASAVDALRRAISLGGESTGPRRRLVRMYRDRSMNVEAVAELLALADHQASLGDESGALEAEEEAAELAPDDTTIRRRVVNRLRQRGETGRAATELEHIAEILAERGNTKDGLEAVNEALELEPERVTAMVRRAELLAASGRTKEALEEFRRLAPRIAAAPPPAAPVEPATDGALQIVRDYDFEHYVVGPTNNFAYATALAVARSPARAYNPLFIYSDVGLGKTHLANAIANFVLRENPKARVIYTNCEDFTAELIDAITNNSVNAFRRRYKTCDLLILDDVQFLAGKERAQEEFFHIFNSLFQAGRQIVVTSDRPPRDIQHLEKRLVSRFGAGVIVDIGAPDIETRVAILKREMAAMGLDLDPSIPSLIAERVERNVRELKGVLTQVRALRDIQGVEITPQSVKALIDRLYPAA
ncbi:MAG: DnaA/Hda family protein, partial [Candidatus Sumerlaeaceae bacterium]|nr:DnaA/Hda family protein [Candidatus Sumerlaeaceae bacterium]